MFSLISVILATLWTGETALAMTGVSMVDACPLNGGRKPVAVIDVTAPGRAALVTGARFLRRPHSNGS